MITKRLQSIAAFALGLTYTVCAHASTLLSVTGNFTTANDVYMTTFVYNPLTGSQLSLQTYGFGGTSNAPGGTTLAGLTLSGGGFDPEVHLFSGSGPTATYVAGNDDGSCPPGAIFGGSGCRDSTLLLSGLAGGTYTVALTAWPNTPNPPPGEANPVPGQPLSSGFTNTGVFEGRSTFYALDVQSVGSVPTTVPEPMSSMLLGSGLLAMGYFLRRKRS